MDATGNGAIQTFKLFDQFGAVIATDVSSTSQQPVPGQQLSTWHLNHLDGSAFTDTRSWNTTAFAFAGNTRSTVNSDPLTQNQSSSRDMHQQNWDIGIERNWASYYAIADPIHEVLNYVGIVDPIGIADGINALWYVAEGAMGREGAFVNAGFSAVGALLPYVGDLFKLGRVGAQAAEGCGLLAKATTNQLLIRGVTNAATGAAAGGAIGGGIAYATGGDVWQGATRGALQGAVGGFTRGFFMNRFSQVCFVAGTPLVMDLDGNSKPIEDIQVGEFVLARSEFDPAGPLELKRVEELFTRTSEIVELELAGRVIGTTVEHPFFLPARGEFVAAKDLQVGDELISHDGRLIKLDASRSTPRVTTVYNMRVADHHTYFVGGSAWGFDVWVHNAKCVANSELDDVLRLSNQGLQNSRKLGSSSRSLLGNALHHIASDKGTGNGNRWSQVFKHLFDGAGMSLQDPINLIRIQGHAGPHGILNSVVFDRLMNATSAFARGTSEYRRALRIELAFMRRDLRDSSSLLGTLVRARSAFDAGHAWSLQQSAAAARRLGI